MSFALSYLFLVLLKNISSLHISIPFKVQNFSTNKDNILINRHLYKDLIVKLQIGEPKQNIQLSACLGEFTTFVIAKDADGYQGGTYNKSLSRTYKNITKEDSYTFQTFSQGTISKESITIEDYNIQINDLEFVLANEIGGNNCYEIYCEVLAQPGILGFKLAHLYEELEAVINTNFVPQLKKKKLISSYNFYFNFSSENEGNIIIGVRPHELDNNTYMYKQFSSIQTSVVGNNDIDWAISFDKIYYGDESIYNEKSVMLRIEFGLIIGSYYWQNILLENFFTPLINEKKCFKGSTNELGSTAYYYYCNSTTDISHFKPFSFSIHEYEYNFTLTKDDLFVKDGDKLMFLMIFGGIYDIIFGYPFLKKYQLIFNQDTKTVGFYIDMDTNEKEEEKEKEKYKYKDKDIYYITGTLYNYFAIVGLTDDDLIIKDTDINYSDGGFFSIIFDNSKMEKSHVCIQMFDILIDEYDRFSYSIQLQSKSNYNGNNYSPQYPGIIYPRIIPTGELAYFVHLFPRIISNYTIYNMITQEGYPKMYVYECFTYPLCKLDYSNLEENKDVKRISDINRMSTYFIETKKTAFPIDAHQYLLVVKCNEANGSANDDYNHCEFMTSIFGEKEEIVLIENQPFGQYMIKGDTDQYLIDISQVNQTIEKIHIDFYVVSGDVSFDLKDKDTNGTIPNLHKYYLANKIFYSITIDKEKNRNVNLDNKLDLLNSADFIVYGGGPVYTSQEYPKGTPFVSNLSDVKTKCIILGGGINDCFERREMLFKSSSYFTNDTFSFLKKFNMNGIPLCTRSWYGYSLLKNNGFTNVLMTGCPAWYDMKYLDVTKIRVPVLLGKIKICVSEPASVYNIPYLIELLKFLRREFPLAVIKLVNHNEIKKL